MLATPSPNDEQSKLWNGSSGRAWIDTQMLLDTLFTPFQDLLVEAVAKRPGSRLLDVGCGTGSTTRALAKQCGPAGRCVGIDISGPMIEAARVQAEREGSAARFLCGDVQRYPFGRASFDAIVSRFGIMFFADPVEAFTNLRHAASPHASLHGIVWRGPAENPFMTTAERAAAPLLPALPPRRPGAPGQFAFEDPLRVAAILEASGWSRIAIRPIDVPCSMPKAGLVDYLTKLGPVGRALETADEATRGRVVDAARLACEPYVHGDSVSFTAACWFVEAAAA